MEEFLDVVHVTVLDMARDGLISLTEEPPPRPPSMAKTFVPLDRWEENIAKAPLGADIDRASWGMDADDLPPPAPARPESPSV